MKLHELTNYLCGYIYLQLIISYQILLYQSCGFIATYMYIVVVGKGIFYLGQTISHFLGKFMQTKS